MAARGIFTWNEEGFGGNGSLEQIPAGTPLVMSEPHGPKLEDFLGGTSTDQSEYNYCNPPVNFSNTSLYNDIRTAIVPNFTGTSRLKSSSNLVDHEFQNSVPYVYPLYNVPECSTWMPQQACGYNVPSVGMELQDFNQCSSKYYDASDKEIITPPAASKGDSGQDYLFGCNLRLHHNPAGATSLAGNMQSSELANLKTMLRQPTQFSERQSTGAMDQLSALKNFSLSIDPISEAIPPTDHVSAIDNSSFAGNPENALFCSIIGNSPKKPIETIGQARTSQFRGVTRHRWTKRYEAHLWDNSCKIEGKSRKGKQVYLGGYDIEEDAARAYDCAALKYWGPNTPINFPLRDYMTKELEEMKSLSRHEYIASLRRKSSGFSRGASIYRGVTRHHQHGRWQARIGRVAGHKDLYLGTFSTQEEAAEAYDRAAIKYRGIRAITNFEMRRYLDVLNEVTESKDKSKSEEILDKNNQITRQGSMVRNNYTLKSGEGSDGVSHQLQCARQYEMRSCEWCRKGHCNIHQYSMPFIDIMHSNQHNSQASVGIGNIVNQVHHCDSELRPFCEEVMQSSFSGDYYHMLQQSVDLIDLARNRDKVLGYHSLPPSNQLPI